MSKSQVIRFGVENGIGAITVDNPPLTARATEVRAKASANRSSAATLIRGQLSYLPPLAGEG